MKTLVWALVFTTGFQCLSFSAFAQSSRVQETVSQADLSLNAKIQEKKQQVAEAEAAVTELQTQLGLARGARGGSSDSLQIKKVFLVTAVLSVAALVYGIAKTKTGGFLEWPTFGRGTFIGLFGLLASGVGYMATDAADITLSSKEDGKLSSDLEQAQLELNALKRALTRLEARAR